MRLDIVSNQLGRGINNIPTPHPYLGTPLRHPPPPPEPHPPTERTRVRTTRLLSPMRNGHPPQHPAQPHRSNPPPISPPPGKPPHIHHRNTRPQPPDLAHRALPAIRIRRQIRKIRHTPHLPTRRHTAPAEQQATQLSSKAYPSPVSKELAHTNREIDAPPSATMRMPRCSHAPRESCGRVGMPSGRRPFRRTRRPR